MLRTKSRKIVAILTVLAIPTFLVVLGPGCAFRRDHWQQTDKVIRFLDLHPGAAVADLGSGDGYFTFALAKATGPTGKVYAVDVDEKANRELADRAKDEGFENVEVILADNDDPLLPESGVDLIFTCNTYHHIEDRVAYFVAVRRYLRPGGRIAIIDYGRKRWLSWLIGHWSALEDIESEMTEAGYAKDAEFEFLSKQNFVIFAPT